MTESEEQTAKQESKISTSKQEGIITRQQWLNRSSFHYGDVVMAWTSKNGRFGASKPWIARIEFVSGELCTSREQKHYPWEGNIKGDQEYDHDFRWPIFFYGTHEIQWLKEENQLKKVETADDIPEAYDPKFEHSEIAYERALFEFYTDPYVLLECFGDVEKHNFQTEELNKWLVGLSEIIPQYWKKNIRKAKTEVINIIEDDKEKDAIQREYKSASFQIKDMDVGDMIGASYPRTNQFEYYYYEGKESKYTLALTSQCFCIYCVLISKIGIVKEKKEGSIFVQFFRYCKGTDEYVENKKDTDNIEEARQGYIYFHLKKDKVSTEAPTAKGCEVFKIQDPNIQTTMRQHQLNWNLKIAQISEDDDAVSKAQSELNQFESAKVVPDYVSNTRKRNRHDAKF